jgi:hypothetical protein
MSALGQKQTSGQECSMSALPPIADIDRLLRNVRFVPQADTASEQPVHSIHPSDRRGRAVGGTVRPAHWRLSG